MLIMLMTLVKEVLRRFVERNSPKEHVTVQPVIKEYVSVQSYLAKHGIGADAFIVSVDHLEEISKRYAYVQAYLEKHGVAANAISISSVE